jgi:ribonuclease Z
MKLEIETNNTMLCSNPERLRSYLPQILEIKNRIFLIDCAEGTQVQLRKTKSVFENQSYFISHLHGDHFFD